MKKTIVRLILAVAILLTALESTPAQAAGGGIPPLCWPGTPQCPQTGR